MKSPGSVTIKSRTYNKVSCPPLDTKRKTKDRKWRMQDKQTNGREAYGPTLPFPSLVITILNRTEMQHKNRSGAPANIRCIWCLSVLIFTGLGIKTTCKHKLGILFFNIYRNMNAVVACKGNTSIGCHLFLTRPIAFILLALRYFCMQRLRSQVLTSVNVRKNNYFSNAFG